MADKSDTTSRTRAPLSRELVLRAAITVADEVGLQALTMRRLGKHLGFEAMSLYKHVDNKEDLLNGIADIVARIGERFTRRKYKKTTPTPPGGPSTLGGSTGGNPPAA